MTDQRTAVHVAVCDPAWYNLEQSIAVGQVGETWLVDIPSGTTRFIGGNRW